MIRSFLLSIPLAVMVASSVHGTTSSPPSPSLKTSLEAALVAVAKAPVSSYEKQCRALIRARGSQPEAKRAQRIYDLQWRYLMTTFPEWATYVGYPGQNAKWTDLSPDAIALRSREVSCLLEMAKSVRRAQLPASERLTYDLFLRRAELAKEEQRFRGEYLAIHQLGGIHQDIAQIFEVMPKGSEAQVRDILARLKAAPTQIDSTLALLKEGLAKNITPPKITLREVPTQISAMIKDEPFESPILASLKELPASIPAARTEALRSEAAEIYKKTVRPKLVELRDFMTETYIPGARESVAWKDLPDGEAWYQYRLREVTTTNMSAQQIHDTGLSEVARIQGEMEKVRAEAGGKKSMAEFQKFLRTDSKFFYSKPEDLLRDYRDIAKRADPELIKIFSRLPRLPYGIAPVPAYSEKSQTTAYYVGGSTEAGRPGLFYANTYDLKSRPKWEMEALTLHEAVPGHHLQIALAQEMEKGPEFRKHDHYTAYVEGWGLYAESLGYEMGFYKDPYSRFGQLTYEMWRACRLVVDTGMHALGWSREKAIEFMKKNLAKPEHDIVVEIDRYIVWAGQATAYKIGQMKIRELRQKTAAALGDRFDVRKFHDVVLGQGSVPLDVLERLVDEYIATEKAKVHPKS